MKISACWIVKNEEGNILRSINSLKGAVDEIVVVDTGSTDDTVKVAQEAGARVGRFEWINDFSAARNYALDLVTGDIVFLLDADEWFDPVLTQNDRRDIEDVFLKNPKIQIVQLVLNNLNEQGLVASQNAQYRIMRNDKGLRYHNSVHEYILYNGINPLVYLSEKWQITHSGYTEGLMASKTSRNIELLEYSSNHEQDPEIRHKHRCVLVREYHLAGNHEDALRNLKLALSEPALLHNHLILHGHTIVDVYYHMMHTAMFMRDNASRLEIRHKVVDNVKKHLKTYPGAATIDLYYEILFALDEGHLLDEIGYAFSAARKTPDSPSSIYREVEAVISGKAAEAAFRRGKYAAAMEYALQTFKLVEAQAPQNFRILMNCLSGQETTDIALLLNSQFDIRDHRTLKFLAVNTRMHGFLDIHAYYLDKCIKAEIATKGDYLYLLILYGKYDEALEIAKSIHEEADDETVLQTITLAAVCSNNAQVFYDNRGIMKYATDVLDAYFSKEPLESISVHQEMILQYLYPLIALAAGLERADEFAEAFSTDRLLVYMVRAKYCIENALFETMLSMESPDKSNNQCRLFAIQAMTMVGRLDEAFYMTKSMLDSGTVGLELLLNLAALSARAQEPLKTAASLLHESYRNVYDKMTDWQDVLNTGYFRGANEKKKARSLKALTFEQFRKQLDETEKTPHVNGFMETCRSAAEFFKKEAMPATAVECLMFALSNCQNAVERNSIYEEISNLFYKIGNTALASGILKWQGISLKS
ncbi:MAG: glycosyltransferase family 2 protein [Clostridiales bacterium]|nr:glycosyltransferase family 2 protein [Clostridiales bacterium]